MKLTKKSVLAISVLMIAGLGLAIYAQSKGALKDADKHFKEKSYVIALKEYEAALRSGQVAANRKDEVAYRILVSESRSEQWDRAVPDTLAFIKARKGTVWEARGLYWLGRLYLGATHEGYRIGDKLTRGADVPKTISDKKPQQIERSELDSQDAREALEAAAALYSRNRFPNSLAEETQLCFDLAFTLNADPRFETWGNEKRWLPLKAEEWRIDPKAEFNPDWATPKKQLYLYTHIQSLNATSNAHASAQAQFLKSETLQRYHESMKDRFAYEFANGKRIELSYPYQEMTQESALRELVAKFPNDPLRDPAQLQIAALLSQKNLRADAMRELKTFVATRPQSKWVSDARAQMQEIASPYFELTTPDVSLGDTRISGSLLSKNLKSVHLSLYNLNLSYLLMNPQDKRNANWGSLSDLNGNISRLLKITGAPVVQWDKKVPDAGDYRPSTTSFDLPKIKPGSYLLVAKAGGKTSYRVVMPSNLTLVQKTDRDRVLLFAANSHTGKPVSGAKVTVKTWFYISGKGGYRSSTVTGKTNASGIFSVPRKSFPGGSNQTTGVLAEYGGSVAFTSPQGFEDYENGMQGYKSYCTTDRAVYRPLQTVYYRNLVMQNRREGLTPLQGKSVHLVVTDPKGRKIYVTQSSTSEFGSLNGKFDLPADAPLGEYQIEGRVGGKDGASSNETGNVFRVEEYKKPEFEVTVKPAAERVKIGEKTSATVKAAYYFGGPVPNAKVSYRIHRNYYSQTFSFPRPYDFLYGESSSNPDVGFRNGAVIAQGTAVTDAKGEAKISFETKGDSKEQVQSDLSFSVEADVKDSSRRTITGSATLKATRHDVAVFLDFPHGYATQGDRVDLEIATRNPSDRPISVEGVAKVFLQSDDPKGKETLAFQQPMLTDKEGRAILKWQADRAGYYRVAFTTRDSGGEEVEGSIFIFVNGAGLSNGHFLYREIFLGVKELYYQEGGQAKLLIVTPEPDCDVLFTREAGSQIMEKQVLHIPGRSLELTLPLLHRDSPNVFFTATLIKRGNVLHATQEVFVPPISQLAKVEVKAEKDRYEPGEKAKFSLRATDFLGRPLRTELALSLTDASLSYIQANYATDIRGWFYGNRRTGEQGASLSNAVSLSYVDETGPFKEFKTHDFQEELNGIGLIPTWPGIPALPYGLQRISNAFASDGRVPEIAGRPVRGWSLKQGRFRESTVTGTVYGSASVKNYNVAGEERSGHWNGGFDAQKSKTQPYVFDEAKAKKLPASQAETEATPRTNFLDTAFWSPAVVTDAQGNASVEVTLPDNLTRWRAATVGNTREAQVGTAETNITVKKDLLVRLEAPRYFVERDSMTVSGIVQNSTDSPQTVTVNLNLSGESLAFETPGERQNASSTSNAPRQTPPSIEVEVPANGEKRVDWQVAVRHPGVATLRLSANSQTMRDATELSFPVLIHGIERAVTIGGVLQKERQASVSIELPEARKPGTSEVVVHLTPSVASVMLDALPYLNDYPYGCVEQTMSRFLPTVLTAGTLSQQGVKLEDLRVRMEKIAAEAKKGRGALKIEDSPYSYSKLKPGTEAPPLESWKSPVFNSKELDRILKAGLSRLRDFQHADGGWGWWKDGESDPYMSAYVLYGLQLSSAAGHPIGNGRLERGLDYLLKQFNAETDVHQLAYEARVLAMSANIRDAIRKKTTGKLFDKRESLSSYSKGLLALALNSLGDKEKASVVLRNLEDKLKTDAENGTAHWEEPNRYWWRWYNNSTETNATILQAILANQPDSKLAPMLVKWLVNRRSGSHWETTRETAMTVYALSDYIRVKKELSPNYILTVALGDKIKRTYKVTPENALVFDNRFVVPDALLSTGKQAITITKEGEGACYFSATTRYFSQEEPIKASGNEVFVTRNYFKLLAGTAAGEEVSTVLDPFRPNPFLKDKLALLDTGEQIVNDTNVEAGPRYERAALKEGETVASGDLLEVELQIDSKNDYEYLVFEDIKPAGCEPVEVRSGGNYNSGLYSNKELRDQKVAFFVTSLPQGRRMLSYRLRAEAPGAFHVLPTNGYAMYAPDVRANSDERTLRVRDE